MLKIKRKTNRLLRGEFFLIFSKLLASWAPGPPFLQQPKCGAQSKFEAFSYTPIHLFNS